MNDHIRNYVPFIYVVMFYFVIISDAINEFLPGDDKDLLNEFLPGDDTTLLNKFLSGDDKDLLNE